MTLGKAATETAVFAGRAAELSILKDAADAAKLGRFSAILISGEPGIGKTRLTEEACIYARELGFAAVAGRCFDSHSTARYFPFIQMFSELARRPARQRATRKRGNATKGPGTTVDIVARLTSRGPLSSRSSPETFSAAQARLFESVVSFLRGRSESCPLLLVLEDLDWADDSSLALLLHLVRMFGAARLMIIATCRANEAQQRFELGRTLAECERYGCYQRIRLKGLAESEAANLCEQLLGLESGSQAGPITAHIARLTNGNPLFIHQVVRYLSEAGVGKGGAYSVLSPSWEKGLAADDAIRELVDARLSQLSKACRDALRHAAVLGSEFEFEVLAQMLCCAAGDLADLMKEACGAAILTEANSDDSSDYAFVHRIIRQSLYERQSRPAKRTAHADAARAIEAVHGSNLDLHLSELALHYARAGRAGNLAKAVEYAVRAGEKASDAAAHADAARHWRTALQLVGVRDRRQRAQLTERLGDASLSSATPAEAARHLQAALKLYAELGQEADAARVHVRLVTAIWAMSPAAIDVGKAVSHSRRAEKLLATRADPAADGELLLGEATVAHAQFRTEEGLIASKRAMDIAEALGNTVIWCQAAALHGHLLFASGKLKEGIGLMEQAAEQAEHTNDLKPRFISAWLLSFSYLLLWDPGSAERTIQAALADTDAGQVEYLRQILVAHLGIANIFAGAYARAQSFLTIAPHHFLEANLRIAEGEWVQAEALLDQQIDRSDVTQNKQQRWTGSLWLARLKRVQGDDARALELLTKTPLIAESLQRIPEEISTRSELALVRLARGEVSEARSEVRRCRDLLDPAEDWRGLSAFVDRAEAAVMAYDGLLDEASQLWASAGEIFSRYRLPWEVAETFILWGSLLARHGRAEESAAKLQGAAQIYRHLQLGARWDDRIASLRSSATLPMAPPLNAGSVAPEMVIQAGAAPSNGIHALVTTHDVALLATLIHDAIAHLMNAIDKAAKLRVPIERIAAATEEISRIGMPVERLVRALSQGGRDSGPVPPPLRPARRSESGRARRQKLDRSHDPGRPL